jgi:hypothetical protein
MNLPIRAFTKFMDFLAEIDNYTSLQFTRRYHETGEFELHINRYMHDADKLEKGNLIILNKQYNKAGIILHKEIQLDQNGKASENLKIIGVTLQGIMARRITVPPTTTGYDRKSGDAETVMKHYVERNFINPDNPKRKIPQLEIAPNRNRGSHIEWESRYKQVSEELASISKLSSLGWMITVDPINRKWVFDVVEGKNLTQDQEEHPPVFFSPDFGTIKSQQFTDSMMNYRNVGYVGGQGEGEEREIVTVGEAEGIDRVETFIDARDVDDETDEGSNGEGLVERGQRKLNDMQQELYFEAQILTPQTTSTVSSGATIDTPFVYEKDFDLGDTVPVFNKGWGVTMIAPMTEMKEIYEGSGFQLEATFGESRPTLISKIKKKFDELSGVEQQEIAARYAKVESQQVLEISEQKILEEEQARIQQALENLQAAKDHAESEAATAKVYAEEKALEAQQAAIQVAIEKSNLAQAQAQAYADGIVTAEESARIQAIQAAKEEAQAQAELAETQAKAYADGRVTEEEQARITDAEARLAEAKTHAETKAAQAEDAAIAYTNDRLTNFVNATLYTEKVEELQSQIDNQIENHFFAYDPSLSNAPANGWTTTEERNKHIGDLFYNTDTGYSYRFALENSVYKWILVRDEGIGKALADAAKAQDTADSKRRVFVYQPTTPYDTGDLWDYNGSVYRSTVTKTSNASFSSADWVLIGDVTGENTAADTDKVGGTNSSTVRDNASAGKSAKDKIDSDVGPGTIEDTIGSQLKADNAEEAAKTHADNLDSINLPDTRSTNREPSWYWTNYPRKVVNEFKSKTVMSVGSSTYGTLTTIVPWSDSSGGEIKQTYENGNVKYYRSSLSASTWSAWSAIENTNGSQEKADAAEAAAKGHADLVSEQAYLDAVQDAEEYADQNAVMKDQAYNGVSITNTDGFMAARNDQLVRTISNATVGIVIQKRATINDPWQNVLYIDTSGNVKFAGELEGASGTFSGEVSGGSFRTTPTDDNLSYIHIENGEFEAYQKVNPDTSEAIFTNFDRGSWQMESTNYQGSIVLRTYWTTTGIRFDDFVSNAFIDLDIYKGIHSSKEIKTNEGFKSGVSRYWEEGKYGADLNNSDMVGVNGIFFADVSEGGNGEGFNFLKSGKPVASKNYSDYDNARITDGTGYLNNKPIFTSDDEVLWQGSSYPYGDVSLYPTKKLSECPNGWILIWSDHNPPSTPQNYHWTYSVIPKMAARLPGTNTLFTLPAGESSNTHVTKCLLVYDDRVVGRNSNIDAGADDVALRYIISF